MTVDPVSLLLAVAAVITSIAALKRAGTATERRRIRERLAALELADAAHQRERDEAFRGVILRMHGEVARLTDDVEALRLPKKR